MTAPGGRWFLVAAGGVSLAVAAVAYAVFTVLADGPVPWLLPLAGAIAVAGGGGWLWAKPEARAWAPARSAAVPLLGVGVLFMLLPAVVLLPWWVGAGTAVVVPVLLLAAAARKAHRHRVHRG